MAERGNLDGSFFFRNMKGLSALITKIIVTTFVLFIRSGGCHIESTSPCSRSLTNMYALAVQITFKAF